MKRILIIIAGVIVLLGIVVGVYYMFFAPGAATLTVGNPFGDSGAGNATPGSGLPNTDGTLSNAGTE
jgi:flagellar basal body-associated protein FliL